MPTGDVQFWIVTGACAAAAAFGLWRVVRAIRAARSKGRGRQTSVKLTIEREERE